MALSDDQKALLRLLAQREEGYEDIAALMGLSVEEVRGRVKAALAALEEGGSAAGPVAADAPPPPRPRASTVKPRMRTAVEGGRRHLRELIGTAAILAAIVLFATGTVDIGGGSGSNAANGGEEKLDERIATGDGQRPTQATLRAVGGGGAQARAMFGRSGQQVLLVFAGDGLERSPKGRSYAISLENADGERIPIAATRVGKDNTIGGQFEVPPDVLGLLATGYDRMVVSRVVNKRLAAALRTAQRQNRIPDFSGEDVLRGRVSGPIVNAEMDGSEGER